MTTPISRRAAIRAGGTVFLGSLAGCYGGNGESPDGRHVPADWRPDPGEWVSAYGYDLGGNLYNPHASPPSSDPELAWQVDFELTNPYPRFSIADGSLFLRTESALTAYDTGDGDELWSAPQDELGYTFYVDGRLYHSTPAAEQALTLDGDLEWEIDDREGIIGEQAGSAYTASGDGLAWYDAESGERRGRIDDRTGFHGVVDGVIYGFGDGAVHGYEHDGDEPTQQWETPVGGPFEIQGTWRTVADGTLHVRERGGAREKRIGRYALADGSVETTGRTYEEMNSFVVAEGVEYLVTVQRDGDGSPETISLTARDDGVLWERTFDGIPRTPVVADGTILMGGDEGELLALDAESGETVWERPDSGGMLAVVGDTVYVFRHGRLLALR